MNSTAQGRIAFQGELGAYSHQACRETYPDMEPVPCPTFEEAIAEVRHGEAKLAMLPIENSLYGRVADIHHLLPESGLYIIREHFVPIRLQLLGVPGAKLEDIREAQSHTVALGQCRRFLKAHGIQPVTGGDTAGSAAHVAEAGVKTRAAIASTLAGELNGLEVLAADIEDADHNTTRFLAMSRQKIKAMGGFATNGVNMVKLESYMVNGSFTATQFYAEVEGHPDDRPLELALEELNFFCKHMKVLGVYPASAYRKVAAARG
jgi:prephenate dehydratase